MFSNIYFAGCIILDVHVTVTICVEKFPEAFNEVPSLWGGENNSLSLDCPAKIEATIGTCAVKFSLRSPFQPLNEGEDWTVRGNFCRNVKAHNQWLRVLSSQHILSNLHLRSHRLDMKTEESPKGGSHWKIKIQLPEMWPSLTTFYPLN